MKKFISIMTTAAMLLSSVSVSVFAEDADPNIASLAALETYANFDDRTWDTDYQDANQKLYITSADESGNTVGQGEGSMMWMSTTGAAASSEEGDYGLSLKLPAGAEGVAQAGWFNIDYCGSGLTRGKIINEFDIKLDLNSRFVVQMRQNSSYAQKAEILTVEQGTGAVSVVSSSVEEQPALEANQWYHMTITFEEKGLDSSGTWQSGNTVVEIREGEGKDGEVILDTTGTTYTSGSTESFNHELALYMEHRTEPAVDSYICLDNFEAYGEYIDPIAEKLANLTGSYDYNDRSEGWTTIGTSMAGKLYLPAAGGSNTALQEDHLAWSTKAAADPSGTGFGCEFVFDGTEGSAGYYNIDYCGNGITQGNFVNEFDIQFVDMNTTFYVNMRQASSWRQTTEILSVGTDGKVTVNNAYVDETTVLQKGQWYHMTVAYQEKGLDAEGNWQRGITVVEIREGAGKTGDVILNTIGKSMYGSSTTTFDHELSLGMSDTDKKALTSIIYFDNFEVVGEEVDPNIEKLYNMVGGYDFNERSNQADGWTTNILYMVANGGNFTAKHEDALSWSTKKAAEATTDGGVGCELKGQANGAGYFRIDYRDSGLTGGNIVNEFDIKFVDMNSRFRIDLRQNGSWRQKTEILTIENTGQVKVGGSWDEIPELLKEDQWYHFKIVYEENGIVDGVWQRGTTVVQIREGAGKSGRLIVDSIGRSSQGDNASAFNHELALMMMDYDVATGAATGLESITYFDNFEVYGTKSYSHNTCKFITVNKGEDGADDTPIGIATSLAGAKGQTVNVTLAFKDTEELSEAGNLIAACYDEHGRLLDVGMSGPITTEDVTRTVAQISVPNEAASVKLFAVNLGTLKHLYDFAGLN